MIRQLIRVRRKRILVDIGTQKDIFLAQGAACIRNHRRVLANVRRMVAWARRRSVSVISICHIHPDNNGQSAHKYCIEGTEGQKKIGYTLLSNRASFSADGTTDLPLDVLRQYKQIILHERCIDPFNEPRIERLLTDIRANEFILIGASAEGAVMATALGLLQRGKRVSVVVDAIGTHNKSDAQLAFRKIKAKGAKLIETKKLAGKSHLRQVGICSCESCQGNIKKTPVTVGAQY